MIIHIMEPRKQSKVFKSVLVYSTSTLASLLLSTRAGIHCPVGYTYRLRQQVLRVLVQIKEQLGKEEEARALELELDETEAIIHLVSAAALDEVRAEVRAEAAATAGVGGAGTGGQGQQQQGEQQNKKKLTRKQQKRKAAQRRKQAAAGTAVAAGTAAAGGVGVEAVTAAAGQLRIDEPEPEPEPDSEPEPEPEECAICLNDLPLPGEEEGGAGGAVLLACSHIFHTVCLERWKDKCLEKAVPYTCAMCRAVVVVAAPANKP